MENPILEAKKELMQWIKDLDELDVIAELLELKEKRANANVLAEPQTEYAVFDDFEERFAKGMTGEELLQKVYTHIESLPWKKK